MAQRIAVPPGSFAHYLRHLPLKPSGALVRLHNGALKGRQDAHAAVLDISVGPRDLQQCADAVIRLRAEFLFANGRQDEIAFHFTSGFKAEWTRWCQGERIRVVGNSCSWVAGQTRDASHDQLLAFLDKVFTYAGTLSLSRELAIATGQPLQAGDVFIQGGSPGHATIVLDVAMDGNGKQYFLLGQSYMPAQDIHVLRNPSSITLDPWYEWGGGDVLITPEWTFRWTDRKRWS